MIISGKIDVTKIDKSRLYKGQKGTYLDCVIFVNDEKDQYGNDGMIKQSVSREERQSGIEGAILGNVKIIYDKPTPVPNTPRNETPNDDIPF